jgi:hypothetical protein
VCADLLSGRRKEIKQGPMKSHLDFPDECGSFNNPEPKSCSFS